MKRALLLGAVALLWSGSARADLPVIDIGGHLISLQNLAQAIKNIAEQEQIIGNQLIQIVHLKATVDAVMHGDVLALANLGPELSGLGLGDLVEVGAGGAEMMDAVSGAAFATGRLSVLADRLVKQDAFYLPPGGGWSVDGMIAQARAAAAQKALAQSSFDASTEQIKALRAARDRASRAGDVTAAAQANAALTGVMAQAQMEGNQLAAARMMQSAQAATLVAQQQQMSRCAYERLAANAKAARAVADAGTVQFFTNTTVSCSTTTTSTATVSLDANGTLTADASATTSVSLASGLDQYLGQSVGSGQCVALVQQADPGVGLTATWVQGAQVQGSTDLQPGTPIATFDSNGRYANATDGSSHAAIYLGQDANGIQVEDQWLGQPAHTRTIRFNSGGTAANSGEDFYVVSHGA